MSALLLVVSLFAVGLCQAETITVYTSANFAPLVIDDKRGLYLDLINYLNRQKLGNLSFKLVYLPRKRLQVKLEEGSVDGIIIGMMPQWFDDVAQTKYLWTQPFALDNFILISNSKKPVQPEMTATLPGKTVGVTLGYVYPGTDQWIAQHGMLRNDALSEEKNISKLLLGRVDCMVVSETVINYYVKVNGLQGKIHFAHVPGQPTERRFLIPHAYRHVHEKLAPVIKRLDVDPPWQKIAAKY